MQAYVITFNSHKIVEKKGGYTDLGKQLEVLVEHRFIVIEKFLTPGGWSTFGGPC
jgi:hypothetical protein